jgi:hypothetical protein
MTGSFVLQPILSLPLSPKRLTPQVGHGHEKLLRAEKRKKKKITSQRLTSHDSPLTHSLTTQHAPPAPLTACTTSFPLPSFPKLFFLSFSSLSLSLSLFLSLFLSLSSHTLSQHSIHSHSHLDLCPLLIPFPFSLGTRIPPDRSIPPWILLRAQFPPVRVESFRSASQGIAHSTELASLAGHTRHHHRITPHRLRSLGHGQPPSPLSIGPIGIVDRGIPDIMAF